MTTTELRCPLCQSEHCCTVEPDIDACGEPSGYAAIETSPCQGDDACTKKLCSDCPAKKCTACDLLSCNEHLDARGVCLICRQQQAEQGSEPECECVPVDVDRMDASDCPAHGRRAA